MFFPVKIKGIGHKVGSRTVLNSSVAEGLNLRKDWFERRTGIVQRQLCSEDENVLTLAIDAITLAMKDAKLEISDLGHETIVLHIQNGFTHITPPSGIILCHKLGLSHCRTLTIDGVCSEPINAIELGAMMLTNKSCERVIISASVDFMDTIDPQNKETVGLFGAGAGALILEFDDEHSGSGIEGIYWENQTDYWDLGTIELVGSTRSDTGLSLELGYYQMNGKKLARVCLSALERVFKYMAQTTEWERDNIDLIISHQPNVKLLGIGARYLKVPLEKLYIPVAKLGNMGPASVLVAFSLAYREGKIQKGNKLMLLSFGLGFSCGAAAIRF